MSLLRRTKQQPTPEPPAVVRAPMPRWDAEQYADAVLAGVQALNPFGMQIHDVAGLTLCEDIVSDLDIPMVTRARVAGYGVRAANIVGASDAHPIDLVLVAVIERRDPLPVDAVASGACVLLAEGAPVPRGVDSIVPVADAVLNGRVALFTREATLNAHLALQGATVADGAPLLSAGHVLDQRSIALLAEVGLDKVLVRPRPRLVVFGVGADLVSPGMPITSVNQHYGAATALITSAARADGATVFALEHARATAAGVRQLIADQLVRADAIAVLADTDAEAEAVGELLDTLGEAQVVRVGFDGERVLAIGRAGEAAVPVLVLPGRPVSAFAAYHAFLRPLLDRLGAPNAARSLPVSRRLSDAVGADEFGPRFVPARLDGEHVRPASGADGMAYDLFSADALVIVPPGPGLEADAEVECLLLDVSRGTPAAPAASR